MSNRIAPILLCAASLAATATATATAAAAQPASSPTAKPAPSTSVAPLTVQGASPKAITKEARVFVDTHATAPNPEIGQISRWHEPVCVQVEGLAQANQASQIKARIEGVAQSVGLPGSRPGCKANVEIVFSDKPQLTMNDVAKRREDLLGYYHRAERDRLKTVSHPIQAWYKTATVGEGNNGVLVFSDIGIAKQDLGGSGFPGRVIGNVKTDDPDYGLPTGCGDAPQFTACLTSEFANVFIVVDNKALQGKTLGPIADYLTVLALSQPKSLDGCAALSSILDLAAKSACAGRDAPDGLTATDAAWLTALYASDAEAKGDGERTDIADRMADILVKASAPAEGR